MTDDAVPALLRRALALLQAGRNAEAKNLYETVLGRVPAQPQALCMLGRLARQAGDAKSAAGYLAAAARAAPEAPQVLAELGQLALMQKDTAAAITHFTRLVASRPDYAEGHFNLARLLAEAGQLRRAVDHFEQAAGAGLAAAEEAWCGAGSAWLGLGDVAAAEAAFQRALARRADYPPALFGRAQVASAQGRFDAAIAQCRRAVAVAPDFVLAWQQLAESRRYSAPDDPDIAAMQALLERPELTGEAHEKLDFALAKIFDDLGDYPSAATHLLRANRAKQGRLPRYDREAAEATIRAVVKAYPGAPMPATRAGGERPTPIFVVGLPRSGTTLVERILAAHPRVAGAGELTVLDGLARRILAPYPGPAAARPETALASIRRGYLEAVTPLAAGSDFVTDKFPGNLVHAGLIRQIFPDAPIVLCRRDPADTGLSIFFQDFPVANLFANDLADIGHYQAGAGRLAAHWRRVMPEAVLTVDYEALVADQRRVTAELLAFCGLAWDEACLAFDDAGGAVATLSRWQVRQTLYARSVGRWRAYASLLPGLEALRTDEATPDRG